MKKVFLLRCSISIILISLSLSIFSQNVHDSIYHKRLFYLCKVWGHVKYYHSNVAAGNVDWDNALITIIDDLKSASTNEQYNNVLETMINTAGEMNSSDQSMPFVPDSLNLNNDREWMNHSIFSENVKALLDTIEDRFRPQANVYAGDNINGPNFELDVAYNGTLNFPSEAIRLLGLFRYWNIINHFFPYKKIMDQNWDSTLVQFIPQISKAENELEYHSTFRELVTYINDSHAFYSSTVWRNAMGPYYPPFLIRYIENESVITKVMNGITAVKIGDVVKEIDGISMYELRDSLRKYSSGSNEAVIERGLNYTVLRGEEGSFNVKVEDENGIRTETLTREEANFDLFDESNDPSYSIVNSENGCNIGVVNMGLLENAEVPQMFQDFQNTDAIIFDVRNYPKGTLWTLVNYLYPTPINMVKFASPDYTYPGRLYWISPSLGNGTSNPYTGNIVILFDERTQSQAEYTCMGLELFPGAIKIGSTTSGADGNIAYLNIPGNIRTAATFLGVFYPDYTPTQRVGIIPDIFVKPSIDEIRNGIDILMDTAFAIIECNPTAIEELSNKESLIIYPNPTTTNLNYELTHLSVDGELIIEVFDLTGKKVIHIKSEKSEGAIDISKLAKAYYTVRITIGQIQLVEKFYKTE